MNPNTHRRTILKAGAAGAAIIGMPTIASAQDVAKGKLKIGLIGCGGRGTGAAFQAMNASDDNVFWAVADVFQNRVDAAEQKLKNTYGDRAQITPGRKFVGLDAYKKLIGECDVVLIAGPPGFRPQHLRAAIEAGKHVFAEKPMAVDMAGVKSVLESAKLAKQKGVSIQHGFCWRFAPGVRAGMQQVHEGTIGDIRSVYGTYLASPPKVIMAANKRPAGMSDVEWQVMNWINFRWLSGGPLLEQAIHTVDKVGWAMNDVAPIAAVATGGRLRDDDGGNIYDHYNIAYEYPNGVFAHVGQRQFHKAHRETTDRIFGSKATFVGPGRPVIFGGAKWRYSAEKGQEQNMYQVCHNEFFAAIKEGKVINTGEYMANSTALAILGREAAYTGKRLTWDELWKSDQDLAPDDLKWDASFPVDPIPRPGSYNLA